MKSKKAIITTIILLSLIAITLLIIMISLLATRKNYYFPLKSNITYDLNVTEEYENTFKIINVEASASDIYIKQLSTDKVEVKIYADEKNTNIENENKTLNIEVKDAPCIGFCVMKKLSKIEVYLPSNYQEKVKVENNYGNITIDEFVNAEFEIDDDCGNIELKKANKATINNDYGNITIGKIKYAELSASSGNVIINEVNEISAKNSYGNIKINKITSYLNIEDECGDIKIENLNIKKSSKIKNDYGNIKIDETNDIYIDAKTSLGDVKVNNNNRKSDIILKIKNDCGDIKVNN